MPDWTAIGAELGVSIPRPEPVRGGDTSAAWRLGTLFVKTGPASASDMYAAEADGLDEIRRSATLRVPEVAGHGCNSGGAWLALEWLDLEPVRPEVETTLGEQLAAMHKVTAPKFGWHRDNTIGLTRQPNAQNDDWVEFLCEQRIGFQLQLAANNGYGSELRRKGESLLRRLPRWFEHYSPQPSLLHGDLWSGNRGTCGGRPVVYDPAVWFGDRETDLAMTNLFGGFSRGFYAAYEAAWPLASGSRKRRSIYQLYHMLNHLNLFGGGYLGRALALMDEMI